MIQKKVCMLGGFAVGKTSLVSQFVSSIFSDKYLTTVGVKVDKKVMSVGDRDITLMLWDIYGQDDFQSIQASYLRGSGGFLLVVDGTRRATLDTAIELKKKALGIAGAVPFIIALNKSDLQADWEVNERGLWQLADEGWPIMRTSAKTGVGVEEAFLTLARAMIAE